MPDVSPYRPRSVAELQPLTDAATCVALSVVLGSLRLLELPAGGSVSLAPLPLLLLALVHGGRRAAIAGFVAGMLHALLGGTIVHPVQLVLDYGLAYAALAVAAPFGHRGAARAAIGVVVAMSVRYACLVTSGIVFFGQYAGSQDVTTYSLLYNATFTVPETLLCLALLPTLSRAWDRANGGSYRPAALSVAPSAHAPTLPIQHVVPRPAAVAPMAAPSATTVAAPPPLVRSAPFARPGA